MKVKVHYGQTLIDLAVQEYGTVEALFLMAKDNGLEVDADLIPGTELFVRDEMPEVADADLVGYFKRNGVKVNQGEINAPIEVLSDNDDNILGDNDNNGLQA